MDLMFVMGFLSELESSVHHPWIRCIGLCVSVSLCDGELLMEIMGLYQNNYDNIMLLGQG